MGYRFYDVIEWTCDHRGCREKIRFPWLDKRWARKVHGLGWRAVVVDSCGQKGAPIKLSRFYCPRHSDQRDVEQARLL